VEQANKTYLRERMFIIEDKLYQVAVIGSQEICQSKEADQFFESFKLLK
jgi:hypothetical protein